LVYSTINHTIFWTFRCQSAQFDENGAHAVLGHQKQSSIGFSPTIFDINEYKLVVNFILSQDVEMCIIFWKQKFEK
jgi:hypothetical protein